MNIENKLIVLRSEWGLSQEQLSKKIGISKSSYARLEKNASAMSAEDLHKILDYYQLSYEKFYETSLPVEKVVNYPEKLVKELRRELENCIPGKDFKENYAKFKRLRGKLEPLLAIRDKALDFPQLVIDDGMVGQTVLSVKLDPIGEKLIFDTLNRESELLKLSKDGGNDDKGEYIK